jgi:histidine ammonia-lyase
MGTIAARDCLRVLQLTEQVAAAELIAVSQGLEIRLRHGELKENTLSEGVRTMKSEVFKYFDFVDEDRPLDACLRQMVKLIQNQHWSLYIADEIL